jgi:hypothetical protein
VSAEPKRRYHIHGDRFEGSFGAEPAYCCRALDLFLTADHFDREEKENPCGGESTEERIRRSMKSYKHHTKRGVPIYRPSDAENRWKTVIDVKDALMGPPKKRRQRSGVKY